MRHRRCRHPKRRITQRDRSCRISVCWRHEVFEPLLTALSMTTTSYILVRIPKDGTFYHTWQVLEAKRAAATRLKLRLSHSRRVLAALLCRTQECGMRFVYIKYTHRDGAMEKRAVAVAVRREQPCRPSGGCIARTFPCSLIVYEIKLLSWPMKKFATPHHQSISVSASIECTQAKKKNKLDPRRLSSRTY
ncbi:hypothetical protein GGR50DRAFT_258459 [Xylaria sp. CBS 124048]|nr:hypothetical protein GGR50DRAFT_258459 [Xylaria sp. CBS 124048]